MATDSATEAQKWFLHYQQIGLSKYMEVQVYSAKTLTGLLTMFQSHAGSNYRTLQQRPCHRTLPKQALSRALKKAGHMTIPDW